MDAGETGPRSDTAGAPSRSPPGLVLGATGLVGGHLVEELLEAGAQVRTAGRRPPPFHRPGLTFEPLDFEALVDGPAAAGAVFDGSAWVAVCLGTTLRRAGSREAFHRVDHDYVLAAARAALRARVRRLAVVSSVGADPRARSFYLRVKGETERDLSTLGFEDLVIARPSLLSGERTEHRPGERWALRLLQPLRPILRGPLEALAPIAARTVARALCRVLLEPLPDAARGGGGGSAPPRTALPSPAADPAGRPGTVPRILEARDLRALAEPRAGGGRARQPRG